MFPSQRASKGFLEFKANKRAKYNAEKKEQQEKQHILAVQRELELEQYKKELEQKKKDKAEEMKMKKQEHDLKFIEKLTAMSAKERKAEFYNYTATMMQVVLEAMQPELREELIELMTLADRKRFGVKKMTDAFKKIR